MSQAYQMGKQNAASTGELLTASRREKCRGRKTAGCYMQRLLVVLVARKSACWLWLDVVDSKE